MGKFVKTHNGRVVDRHNDVIEAAQMSKSVKGDHRVCVSHVHAMEKAAGARLAALGGHLT